MNDINFDTLIEFSLLSKNYGNEIGKAFFSLISVVNGEVFDEKIELLDNSNINIGRIEARIEVRSPYSLYIPKSVVRKEVPDYVLVYVVRGEKIIQKQYVGNQDAFVAVTYNGKTDETRELLTTNTSPEWKSRFIFPLTPDKKEFYHDYIEFRLESCNIIGNTSLGLYLLPIKPYIDGLLYDDTIEMRDNNGRLIGRLFIKIQCVYKPDSKIETEVSDIENTFSTFIEDAKKFTTETRKYFLTHSQNNVINKEDALSFIDNKVSDDKRMKVEIENMSYEFFLLLYMQTLLIV